MATTTLLVTLLVIIQLSTTRTEMTVLKIGVILPEDNAYPWSLQRVLPAIEIAVETVKKQGTLTGHHISINASDSQCSSTQAPLAAIEMYKYEGAHVFFGPACNYALAPVARFTPYWNIPLISAGGQVADFDNKAEFELLTRISGAYSYAASAFIDVARVFNWARFGLIYHDNKFYRSAGKSSCSFKMEALFKDIAIAFYSKPWYFSFDENRLESYNLTQILMNASKHARILVVCASDDSVREMMMAAHDLHLDTSGQYVFINFDIFGSKTLNTKPWYRHSDTDERNNKAKTAYQALLTLRNREPASPQYKSFSREVKRRAFQKYDDANYGEEEVNSFVGAYHDAVLLYALSLNETLADGFSVRDGREITKRMWNRTFEGITGIVSIDTNGDRVSDFSLLDMDPTSGEYQVAGNYFGTLKQYEPVVGKVIHWTGPSGRPPPDTPRCGFDKPLCPPVPPEAPHNLTIVSCSSWSMSAELRWEPGGNGGSEVTGYIVETNSSEDLEAWNIATKISGDVEYAKVDLYPWADIHFRVIAINDVGSSEPSLPSAKRCALPPDRPLQNPSDVRVLTHEKGKLIITWKPLPRKLQGGQDLRYVISWRRHGIPNPSGWDSLILFDPAASRFETRVVGTYRLYEIRVEAENAFGKAPQEALLILGRSGEYRPLVTPQDLRLDDTKPTEEGCTHFVWLPVDTSPDVMRGEFRGYELHCESDDGTNHTTFISKLDLGINAHQEYVQGTILNLPPGSMIRAKVAVKNNHYTGPYSETLMFRTPGDPVARDKTSTKNETTKLDVGGVEIINITASNNTIHLAWKISTNLSGFAVYKYRVDCRHYANGKWATVDGCRHLSTKKSHVTIANLMPASMYNVRVKGKLKGHKKNVIKSNWHQINTTRTRDTGSRGSNPIRLPETVRPLHYKLTFDPKIYEREQSEFRNEGKAEVTLRCIQRTSTLFLHSKDLNWTKVELRNQKQKMITIIELHTMTDVEMVEIIIEKPLKVNKTYQLYIEYSGKITDILQGFYYSPYKGDSSTKYTFTTLMQPTDGRRVFPCFDEPDFKATFQVNIVRHKSWKTTSNAALDRTELRDEKYVIDVYDATPKMSTYLVAFAIGDFDYLETTAGTTLLRTWARTSMVQQTKFALDVGARLFEFFENYFQIKYPMPKLDLVAVPTMIFNGMEHWGMITFRESGLLYEESVSSEAQKEWTAVLIAHELSHQWFGNLVTPQWWDHLWLNEGFATYMMFLAVDAVLPEWKIMNKLPVDYRGVQNIMSIDDSLTSHPVYVHVSHPNEINEIFDLVSYAKGCAVIRMLHFFLGNKTFVNGLTRYLTEYSYSTATQDDLWGMLEMQAEEDGISMSDVKSVMDTWLLEMNYPVVTISRDRSTTITLSQTPFLLTESERQNRSKVYWQIPFVYTHQKEQKFNKNTEDIIWLHEDGLKVRTVDKSLQDSTWIIGNVQQLGFYRVNYDKRNWLSLINQLKNDHLAIPPINRAQIIDDAWHLARAGLLDLNIALSTLDYLEQEQDYVPWKAAFRVFDYLDRSLQLSQIYGRFLIYMKKKLEHVYDESVTKYSHYDKIHHSAVMTHACKYGLEACTNTALTNFDSWLLNSSYRVDPDYKIPVFSTGVHMRGESAWNAIFQRFQETDSASDRIVFIRALSNIREPWVIKRFLHLSLSSDVFSNTERVDVVEYVSYNPVGRLLTWDFVVENWNAYFERYGSGTNLFAKLVKGLTRSYNTEAELNKVEAFVNQHEDLGTATREFQKSTARIKFNINWMEKNYKIIAKWLYL